MTTIVTSTELPRGTDRIERHLLEAIAMLDPDHVDYWTRVIATGRERGLSAVQAVAHHDATHLVERATWFHAGVPWREVDPEDVDIAGFDRLPLASARKYRIVPLTADTTTVAMADPGDILAVDEIRQRFGNQVVRTAAPAQQIAAALDFAGNRLEAERLSLAAMALAAEHHGPAPEEDEDTSSGNEMATLVAAIVERAVALRASDIHLEPSATHLEIRYRIDGVLRTEATHPRSIAQGAINRLKVLARMDLGERRKPQDGRYSAVVGNRSVDLRCVVLPSVWGESAVLRILDTSSMSVNFDHLGFAPDMMASLSNLLRRSNGAILVTGPTGSGKSTTLYSALRRISGPQIKTLAIEDPIEYRIAGVSQHQVEAKRGFTFATALRSFVRADADVIFVGEIRDRETAEMAMDAAFTGHLVLSSFHARSAVSTPIRLTEMGLAPYTIAAGLSAVLGQRLLRRLCPACKTPDTRPLDDVDWGKHGRPPEIWTTRQATGTGTVGCAQCAYTGYKGRLAVGELLVVDDGIIAAIAERIPLRELTAIARRAGMTTLWSDAMRRVAEGSTSVDEAYRVIRETA